MTVEEPKRAISAGSKRFSVRELASSVIPRKLRHILLHRAIARLWSRRQQETLGEQVHACPAQHLTLEHLQAIDLAFNRPLTPGPRHPGLHGGIIRTQPFGQASEGCESARGRARQPWIELGRLALTDEGGEVLCERHGFHPF